MSDAEETPPETPKQWAQRMAFEDDRLTPEQVIGLSPETLAAYVNARIYREDVMQPGLPSYAWRLAGLTRELGADPDLVAADLDEEDQEYFRHELDNPEPNEDEDDKLDDVEDEDKDEGGKDNDDHNNDK